MGLPGHEGTMYVSVGEFPMFVTVRYSSKGKTSLVGQEKLPAPNLLVDPEIVGTLPGLGRWRVCELT